MHKVPTGYPPAFQRAELIRSARAESLGIDNTPTLEHEANLKALAWMVLWPLREALNGPIRITSGYRSASVNRTIKGSSATSQHMLGQAADIVSAGGFTNAAMFHYIRQTLPYDQLIWEYGTKHEPLWVHVSYRPNPRGTILITTGTPAKPSYAPWRA
jgi:hypothetical protein